MLRSRRVRHEITLTMGGPTATTATSTYPAGTASRRTGDRRGEQWSTGPGLCYYRARYYNPAMGRFISEDPLGFAGSGANLYAYGDEDPIDQKDLEWYFKL